MFQKCLVNIYQKIFEESSQYQLLLVVTDYQSVSYSQSLSCYLFLQHQSKVSLSLASGDLLATSACLGADTLLKLLGNYCRNKDIKTAITVGIVGMITWSFVLFPCRTFTVSIGQAYSLNDFFTRPPAQDGHS